MTLEGMQTEKSILMSERQKKIWTYRCSLRNVCSLRKYLKTRGNSETRYNSDEIHMKFLIFGVSHVSPLTQKKLLD